MLDISINDAVPGLLAFGSEEIHVGSEAWIEGLVFRLDPYFKSYGSEISVCVIPTFNGLFPCSFVLSDLKFYSIPFLFFKPKELSKCTVSVSIQDVLHLSLI